MRHIEPLYTNDTGMAFFWMDDAQLRTDRVQLVFKETGFHLSEKELRRFSRLIDESGRQNHACESCAMKRKCARFLLKTPIAQVDLAVTMDELYGIKDLVQGALFRMELWCHLHGAGRN